jgi:8-oxo-dGTP pyrophosphatase MutT (NUDIX family)
MESIMLPVYFAQKAFVLHNGALLAVRRCANDRHYPLHWEVPGGRLEAGEDLNEHLAREVFEETGIQITPDDPFHVWKWEITTQNSCQTQTIVAVARLCYAETIALSADGRVVDDDLDLMEWVPLAVVRDYQWIPNMIPALNAFLSRVSGL